MSEGLWWIVTLILIFIVTEIISNIIMGKDA